MNSTKRTVIYHGNDMAGVASGHLAIRALNPDNVIVGQYRPDETFDVDGEVYFVDYFNKTEVERLLSKGSMVTVYDYHRSKAADFDDIKGRYPDLLGSVNPDEAALCQVWRATHPGEEIPEWVKLLDLCERYQQKDPLWDRAVNFYYGLQSQVGLDPEAEFWEKLVTGAVTVDSIVEFGKVARATEEKINRRQMERYSFDHVWQGRTWLCCNTSLDGEAWKQHTKYSEYEYFMCFQRTPNGDYKVSLKAADGDVEPVLSIAQSFGGNGHPKYAGFNCSSLKDLGFDN